MYHKILPSLEEYGKVFIDLNLRMFNMHIVYIIIASNITSYSYSYILCIVHAVASYNCKNEALRIHACSVDHDISLHKNYNDSFYDSGTS